MQGRLPEPGRNVNMTLGVIVVMNGVADEIGDEGCDGGGVARAKCGMQIGMKLEAFFRRER